MQVNNIYAGYKEVIFGIPLALMLGPRLSLILIRYALSLGVLNYLIQR